MIDELAPIQKGIMGLKEEVFSIAENITKGGKKNIYFQNQVYFDSHLKSYNKMSRVLTFIKDHKGIEYWREEDTED